MASATIAAVKYHVPQFQRKGDAHLPLTNQALRGYMKTVPIRSRLPLPPPVVAAVANNLYRRGLERLAVGVVMGMILYLRPGEICDARKKHLAPPVPGLSGGLSNWSLVLNLCEDSTASKTCQYDDSILFDDPEFD